MAAPAPLFATVIHLATGHVLAAVSSVGLEPKLEDLTAGEHVRVRFPAGPGFINVPVSVLTATRVAVTADVLDRPQHYLLGSGNPPLTLGTAPVLNNLTAATLTAGAKAVVVWQDGSESVAASGPLGAAGVLPGTPPPGATHQLLACEGEPLYLDPLP